MLTDTHKCNHIHAYTWFLRQFQLDGTNEETLYPIVFVLLFFCTNILKSLSHSVVRAAGYGQLVCLFTLSGKLNYEYYRETTARSGSSSAVTWQHKSLWTNHRPSTADWYNPTRQFAGLSDLPIITDAALSWFVDYWFQVLVRVNYWWHLNEIISLFRGFRARGRDCVFPRRVTGFSGR